MFAKEAGYQLTERDELALADELDLQQWRKEWADEKREFQPRTVQSAYGRLRLAVRTNKLARVEVARIASHLSTATVDEVMRIVNHADWARSELCAARDAYRRSKCDGN